MDTWNHLKHIATFPKIGPDMYFTHWLLFFKPLRLWFGRRMLGAIGKGSEVRPYTVINGTTHVYLGDNVTISDNVRLICDIRDPQSKIIIGDSVLIGPNTAVYATTHTFRSSKLPISEQPVRNKTTVIKSGAWIGINCVIMPGVTIGKNAVVSANTVVTQDVPDFAIVAREPMRIVRTFIPHNGVASPSGDVIEVPEE